MHRVYCVLENIFEDRIIINDKKQIHHMRDVLWIKPKDEVAVFDEKGNSYITEFQGVNEGSIILLIKEKKAASLFKKTRFTVACAIPKKSRFDEIVDKLTQLGVDRIIPLKTERVIVKLDREKETLRLERWRNVALAASCQSQRNILPDIEPVKALREVLDGSGGYDLKLIPTLLGERKLLIEIPSLSQYKNIIILIGPEGDFSDEEIEMAMHSGFIPVTLGDTVLRVDTAAIAVVSMLKFMFN